MLFCLSDSSFVTSVSNWSIRLIKPDGSNPDGVDGVELTDFGAPMYLPMDRRGADATRPDTVPPLDTEPVVVAVPFAAPPVVADDTEADGRRPTVVVPDGRNDPARDDVAAAADVYVPSPPIVRTDGAANAPMDTAAPQNNDNKDVFIPSRIFISYDKLYHNFDLIPNRFF